MHRLSSAFTGLSADENHMVSDSRIYDDPGDVFAESGELLGTARLKGRAFLSPRRGLWSWSGRLLNASFDAGVLLGAGELRLEFEDRAVGRAFCTRLDIGTRSAQIELTGNGTPPRVETK